MTGEPTKPTRQRPVEEVSYRWLFWTLALLTVASTVWVVWDETVTRRPWKRHQDAFNALLSTRGLPAESIRVHQIDNPELGLVDRCHTCHRAIDRPGFESDDIPLVLRTHPDRKRLLGTNHPIDAFGCTTCHRGQGAQLKGVSWWSFDHGRNDPYWDEPMLTGAFVESTCVGCHEDEDPLPGAETFNRGRALFEDLRCFGCHASPLVAPSYAAAPSFDHLNAKSSPAFLAAWLAAPAEFRPGTRMPQFWPASDDPARDDEIASIVAFIGTIEPRAALPDVAAPPDVDDPELIAAGAQLFDEVGCRGCHALGIDEDTTIYERFGPDLARVGEKASARWLAAWLADPAAVSPGTRMPNLRLADAERDALVAFLVAQRRDGAPAVRPEWTSADPDQVAAGREAVQKYGCYGCHDIPGFEDAGDAGAPLADFGDKTADRLAWGDAPIDCDRPALECWTITKLHNPRRFAGADLVPLMPDTRVSAEDALALSVFVLGHRRRRSPEAYRRTPPPDELTLQAGERIVARQNCRGCHEIGRAAIATVDEDGELDEIQYTPFGAGNRRFYEHPAAGPPPLTFAGKKFQYAWLFDFLTAPTQIRPWLVARMPAFGLADDDKTALIRYLAERDRQGFPFRDNTRPRLGEADRAGALELFTSFQCARCHDVGAATELQPGELAPDLTTAAYRLRADWMRAWLLAPQSVQPGTRMPTFFPLEDDEDPTSIYTPFTEYFDGDVLRQIDALVAIVLGLDKLAPASPDTSP